MFVYDRARFRWKYVFQGLSPGNREWIFPLACGQGGFMLWVICGLLLALWLTFMATSVMMGGMAHLLLLAAIAVVLFQAWSHRKQGA